MSSPAPPAARATAYHAVCAHRPGRRSRRGGQRRLPLLSRSRQMPTGTATTRRLVRAISFVTGRLPAPADACGHGTHVAGIIAGNGSRRPPATAYTHTYYGIARQASIIERARSGCPRDRAAVTSSVHGRHPVGRRQQKHLVHTSACLNLSLGHPVGESRMPMIRFARLSKPPTKPASWSSARQATTGGRRRRSTAQAPSNEGWGTAYGSIQTRPANDPVCHHRRRDQEHGRQPRP